MIKACPCITHVIFDFDGLIADTEQAYTLANQEALAQYGKRFTMSLKASQMGRKHDDAIAWLLNAVGLNDSVSVAEYSEIYDAILLDLLPKAPILPGVERLVEHLHRHRIPLAIVTGSSTDDFALKTQHHTDLMRYFSFAVLSGDDPECEHGKPAPDCFNLAARRFVPAPESSENVLVLEDAPNGVEAAFAAGMQVVMVPDPNTVPPERRRGTQVLNSLLQFDPVIFGLPPFDH